MSDTNIREVLPQELLPYIEQAKREHCIFNTKTKYYAIERGANILGFAGIMFYKNKCVFQSDFIRPEYRKQGLYTQLIQYRLDLVRSKAYKVVEINCLKTSLHANIKAGAKIVKEFKNCTALRYDL